MWSLQSPLVIFMLLVGVMAGSGCVFLVRKRWRFTDTPTSDAGHVFPGLSEVHGVVESIHQPLAAASDGSPCVWWSYQLERKHTDSKGNSNWVTEEQGVTAMPFLVRDRSGAVTVIIDENVSVSNADTRDIEHLDLAYLRPFAREMKKTYTGGKFLGGLFGSNELHESIAEYHGSWRAQEHRLRVGDQVFLTAHARLTAEGDRVELAHTDAQGKRCTFELSVGDERAAMSVFASPALIAVVAVAALVFGAIGGQAFRGGPVIVPAAMVVTALVLLLAGAWNRVRRTRERGAFAWSLIDVACEQRANTVPQLQAVVGAALAHEHTLLTTMAAARGLGRSPSDALVDDVRAADTAAAQVVACIEALPSLRTQPNVAHLMDQLRLLNDRVAFGRRFYNDSVLRLQNRLTQFPDSLIAKLAGVQPLPLIDHLDAPEPAPPPPPPSHV